ncbi:hypothetical protein BJ165DRAFT_1350893 [Panaeolus papilionaceus]|nr:hypothetical protein BJ165DRAFT_1350893 [Panaeolus papilionaceus]
MSTNLKNVLENLRVPTDFTRVNGTSEVDLASLDQWKAKVSDVLEEVRTLALDTENMTDLERGDLVSAVAPFGLSYSAEAGFDQAEWEPWRTDNSNRIAKDILALPALFPPSKKLVLQVLVQNLKPIFKSSAHPHINPSTGRKVAIVPNDPLAMQDYFEAQTWKKYLGVDKVVLWCLRSIKTDWYEDLWHLLVPPTMAFLDDYEVNYKLRGVLLVSETLANVPENLFQRTGIDGLLRTSLGSCLSHLDNSMSPDLVRHAITTSVTLIVSTTIDTPSQPSSRRFDELSSLLGEGIISGVWMYSEDKPNIVRATFDSIPIVMRALGIGTTRFLQALVPQLAYALKPRPLVEPDREMQHSAINVLCTISEVCTPRIPYWSETILDAVGRCWVAIIDEEGRLEGDSAKSGEWCYLSLDTPSHYHSST